MPYFLALLRGVNVGRAKRVPMAELRALLAGLGYTDVATLLNSGNAVFRAAAGSSSKHASDIASAIAAGLRVEVPVIVKSAKELAAIASENPFARLATDPSRLLVAFAQDTAALSALAAIEALIRPPEQFAIGRKAAFLLIPTGILASQAGTALLGKSGASVTTRNWATVLKLQALLPRVFPGRAARRQAF
jgi:uncharacterized protein (DUF1697 family)